MSGDEDTKPTHHFGRGGAGNLTRKDPKSPVLPPQSTPVLKSEHYTTGRGGTGNMAKNDLTRPEEARAAQDVDVPVSSLSEGPRTVGRGGQGNVIKSTEDESNNVQASREKIRRTSSSPKGGRTSLKNLVEKGKDLLSGNKDKAANNEQAVQ